MSRIKQTIFLLTITMLFSSYQDFTEAFINVSKKSNPAIVSIISQKEIEFNNPFQSNPFFHDDFFPKEALNPDQVLGLERSIPLAIELRYLGESLSEDQLNELIQIPPRN